MTRPMTPTEVAQVRHELSLCHQALDAEFATAHRLLNRIEAEWRAVEAARQTRLVTAEIESGGLG